MELTLKMVAEEEDEVIGKLSSDCGDASLGPKSDGTWIGQTLRDAHRAFARALQAKIAVHGVTMGQWTFLRALWEQDGLTQRELSQRVGMMELTTVTALNGMERSGFVVRVRNPDDRRKVNIFLTERGRALQDILLPYASKVAEQASEGLSHAELQVTLDVLFRMISNLDRPGQDSLDSID